jgi:hypothetical protein
MSCLICIFSCIEERKDRQCRKNNLKNYWHGFKVYATNVVNKVIGKRKVSRSQMECIFLESLDSAGGKIIKKLIVGIKQQKVRKLKKRLL